MSDTATPGAQPDPVIPAAAPDPAPSSASTPEPQPAPPAQLGGGVDVSALAQALAAAMAPAAQPAASTAQATAAAPQPAAPADTPRAPFAPHGVALGAPVLVHPAAQGDAPKVGLVIGTEAHPGTPANVDGAGNVITPGVPAHELAVICVFTPRGNAVYADAVVAREGTEVGQFSYA